MVNTQVNPNTNSNPYGDRGHLRYGPDARVLELMSHAGTQEQLRADGV